MKPSAAQDSPIRQQAPEYPLVPAVLNSQPLAADSVDPKTPDRPITRP
jgi:hypothetical protein